MTLSDPSKIALVILNWNGKKLLEKFLPNVIQYSAQATLYVADNNSSDDSIAFLQQHYPEVRIIQNSENYGFAKGYNQALKQVSEPYYCLLNSDIEVTPNWLEPILKMFQSDNQISIIQPKILDYNNKDTFEYAGAAGGFIDKYGFAYCRGRIFDTLEKDTGQYNDQGPIFWASGACFFIKKQVYWDLQGFDQSFFAHQEEIDLCWRAFNAGYQTHYCGQSSVYHVGGATLNYSDPKKTYLNFRNSLVMLYKNLPKKKLFSTLFARLTLDGIAGIKMILSGRPMHCFAIVKAHFGFYNRLLFSRPQRQAQPRENYYKTTSIVAQYFIKNRRKYRDII